MIYLVAIGDLNPAEAYATITSIIIYVAGMVVYSVFIFKFYRFLGRKNIFELDLDKYENVKFSFFRKTVVSILHFFKYVLFLPLLVFFWFSVLTILLIFLAKKQPLENILTVSITMVSAIRVTAYYTEDLSRDLAKLLPFALLGVTLVDISYFSFSEQFLVLLQLTSMWKTLVYYLMFVIILELFLKLTQPVFSRLFHGRNKIKHLNGKNKEVILVDEQQEKTPS